MNSRVSRNDFAPSLPSEQSGASAATPLGLPTHRARGGALDGLAARRQAPGAATGMADPPVLQQPKPRRPSQMQAPAWARDDAALRQTRPFGTPLSAHGASMPPDAPVHSNAPWATHPQQAGQRFSPPEPVAARPASAPAPNAPWLSNPQQPGRFFEPPVGAMPQRPASAAAPNAPWLANPQQPGEFFQPPVSAPPQRPASAPAPNAPWLSNPQQPGQFFQPPVSASAQRPTAAPAPNQPWLADPQQSGERFSQPASASRARPQDAAAGLRQGSALQGAGTPPLAPMHSPGGSPRPFTVSPPDTPSTNRPGAPWIRPAAPPSPPATPTGPNGAAHGFAGKRAATPWPGGARAPSPPATPPSAHDAAYGPPLPPRR